MVGQVTITAGINVAAAIYLIGAASRIFGEAKYFDCLRRQLKCTTRTRVEVCRDRLAIYQNAVYQDVIFVPKRKGHRIAYG